MYPLKKTPVPHRPATRYWLPLAIILFWLLLIIPFYLPAAGGDGLKLPQNIITWGIIAATTAAIWSVIPDRQTLLFTATARWIVFGVLILAIPLFYTSTQWRDIALWRWAGLAGGAFFYLSLLQYSLPRRGLALLLYAILASAAFQAGIALMQFFTPDTVPAWFAYPTVGGRPYGTFMQVNVLASFIATGLVLALLLLLLPGFSLSGLKAERVRLTVLGLMLLILPMTLVWLQSRIGWLGSGVAVVMLLLTGWQTAKKRTLIASGLIVLSLVFAVIFQIDGNIHNVDHEGSNFARLAIMDSTLGMIAEKPWLGWGYGGFEYNFQHYRLAQGLSTVGLGVVSHPHNDVLLWWSEGGLVALLGMLALIYAGVRLVWQAWRPQQHCQQLAALGLSLVCSLLPILLHSQTEYPFVLSAAHWAIFLLLLAQLDRLTSPVTARCTLSPAMGAFAGRAIPVISVMIIILAGGGLYANLALTSVERYQVRNIEPARQAMKFDPGINRERWNFDEQTHALLEFNQTRDPRLLNNYALWAQRYLARHIDKNVYASWLLITQFQHNATMHHRLREEAHGLFPEDPRFQIQIPFRAQK